MRIPTRLRTAAQIALAAVALAAIVATPAAQPAFADNPPPPPTTREPQPSQPTPRPDLAVKNLGFNPHDGAGHFKLSYEIQNVGTASSKPILLYTYCSYPVPGSILHEVAAAPLTVVQPLPPAALSARMNLDCIPRYGFSAVAARVLISSEGDTNTSNNQLIVKK